ncbi:hypothetical protein [Rhizobium leguminosarum]|uniref:hypothetical protein n=1 Tax=Rhizobium leguminosarum TaxID=384 RepID=UPI001FE1F72C|nr:hypothetical protein [Rhizobium leguminosarum]
MGFDFYLVSVFPRGDRTAFIENRLISNWPQSLVGFYDAADLFYCSRPVTAMKRAMCRSSARRGRLRAALPIRKPQTRQALSDSRAEEYLRLRAA